MRGNTYNVDTAFHPRPVGLPPHGFPPAMPPPGFPFPPPGSPTHIDGRRPRRWPLIVTAAIVGATVASVTALAITLETRNASAPAAVHSMAPAATITVAAPTPTPPAPLPTAQADRQTCENGWIPAGNLTDDAIRSLHTLPSGTKVGDPAIASNPAWAAAVQQAASSYLQAAQALDSAIAPGTTPVLNEAAHTAVDALRLLGNAIATSDPIAGNAGEVGNMAGGHVGLLCKRLAPR